MAQKLSVPNGIGFDAERQRHCVIDTLSRAVIVYEVDQYESGLSELVVITDFMGLKGNHHRMVLASVGSLWVSIWGGGSMAHYL